MQMRQILLVGAALLASTSTVLCAQPFTFYALVLHWPPSVCNSLPAGQTCIHDIPESFTVHGLWPQRKDASPVHPGDDECNENFFTATRLDNILKRKSFYTNLKQDWPNLLDEAGGDPTLWSIEWNGHGICSDLQNDPLAYFKCVTVLFDDRKFKNLRQDVGIEVGQSYTLADVQQKLKGKYGVNPQIACNKKIQLWEIRFCYKRVEGKEPVDLQDCPKLSDTKYPCDQNGIQLPRAPAPPPSSTPRMVSDEPHSEL
ncbi:ribonuclease 1-like [Hibiscus syriacus]|uniref:ribonuclease 1-like n=1 Tax=Hibiscus syriacus TaxID=106335 RepID=UPI00192438F0|nr:ribonuclease 1-like [Hibiscus syriacus]